MAAIAVVLGSATNPSSGALITGATSGNVPPGVYTVTVTTELTGTIAAGDLNNMQLQVGSTVIGPLLTGNGVSATATGPYLNPPIIVSVPATSAITVNAIAAASGASAVYKAHMVVTSG